MSVKNNAADDENKERLTSEEFSDLIPHLSFKEILQIEILLNDKTTWQTFIETVEPKRVFRCTLCDVKQSRQKNIITHISGKRHQSLMQKQVKDIFHAEYTYPKSTQKLEIMSESKSTPKSESTLHSEPKSILKSAPEPQTIVTKITQPTNVNTNVKENNTKPADKPKENPTKQQNSTQKLVKNPLAVAASVEKINTAKEQSVKPPPTTKTPITEVTEIVIIDDDDDEEMPVVNTKNDDKQKSANKIEEPPAKKPRTNEEFPKIMVASNLKSTEKINKNKEIETSKSPQKKLSKSSNNDDENEDDIDDKNKVHGFLGVEYVVKVIGGNYIANYRCSLCELKLNFNDMQNHLLGYSHRLKFCEKHFPTAIQQFRQYIVDVPADEHYKVMIPVLQKLAEAIEKHYGLSKPFEVQFERYERERIRVLTEVFERFHASEKDGPTFTHVVNSKDVDKYILQRHNVGHQTKVVNGLFFDNMKPNENATIGGNSIKTVGSNKRSLEIDSASIVKMANEMRMQFQLSQPYHVENIYTDGHQRPMMVNRMPPKPYMQQQQQQQPYMGGQPPPPQFQQQSFVDDETHKRMVESFLKANNKNSNHHGHGVHGVHGGHATSSTRSHRKEHYNERNRHDFSRSTQHNARTTPPRELHVNPQHDIWRSYCRLVDHKLDALNERFKQYKENPESHPSYRDEWLKFWNRRKQELMASGKDYRSYDFQPEWVPYFNRRIREIYEEDFQALKIQSREELSLPFTNEYLKDMKYHVEKLERKISPNGPRDYVNATKKTDENIMTANRPTSSAHAAAAAAATITRTEKPSTSAAAAAASLRIEDEQTPTFVSVLRLLVALEEHLGSLGPKIVELLIKALQAEKSSPAHGIALINDENCSLLETAMEKFKGLILTGILDNTKERALKKAIAKVNVFLDVAKELKEKTKELVSKRPTQQSTQTNILEEKIAAALTAQGATNFDREHLEKLAAVCLLLDKKKKEAATTENRNRTTLQQQQKPLSDALSDIMGNISTETRSRPSTTASNDSSNENILMQNYNNSNNNDNNNRVLNSERNFGNTYGENNFSNNRNMNNERMMTGWQQRQQFLQQRQQQQQPQQQQQRQHPQQQQFLQQRHQQQPQQQQQQRPQQTQFEQQNSNQNWSNNRQPQNFQNTGNRSSMRQPPSYRYN